MKAWRGMFAAWFVAGALCLTLVGCGGSTSPRAEQSFSVASSSEPSASATTTLEASTSEASVPEASASEASVSEASASATVSASAEQSASSSTAASESSASASQPDIAGRWDTVEMSKDGQTMVISELSEEQRALAAQQYWVFNTDGSLDMIDEAQDFTQTCNWELNGSTITISYEGVPMMTAEYDGTYIVTESEGITMKLQKSA